MRRFAPLWTVLALAAAGPALAPAAEAPPTYKSETLAPLAVMRDGRVKPLDTLARMEVRKIYGRDTIKLLNPDGTVRETWGPVAAFFDWSARPDAWDDEDFLLVEYPPLKELLLAGAVKGRVAALAGRLGLPDPAREALMKLTRDPVITARDLAGATALAGLKDGERKEIQALARKLGEGSKYLSPRDLEDARIEVEVGPTTEDDPKPKTFAEWFLLLANRRSAAGNSMGGADRFSPIEQHALEAGDRLLAYQTIRGDHAGRGPHLEPFDRLVPRPHDAAYLKYSANSILRASDEERAARVPRASEATAPPTSELERDAAHVLLKYFQELQKDDQTALFRFMSALKPGAVIDADAPKVVRNFQAWLRESAEWVPMHTVRETGPDELVRAGYPEKAIANLLATWGELVAAEKNTPGRVSEAKAAAVVTAARGLGEALGSYPSTGKVAAETRFNAIAPFYRAPQFYGAATLLLLICLGIPAGMATGVGKLRKVMYLAGIASLLAGIGWEVFGFAHRVYITGWAPVTNMYETVVWVALVASIIGVVLEAIYRKTYAALAAGGVALLATVLAYNVPLLDANIKSLPPVLRSNYWLTIHVMTIVSSYAAFALAMGLGLIGVCYYLTATYRRDVGYFELATPLVFAPFLAALGWGAMHASSRGLWPPSVGNDMGYRIGSLVAGLGGCLAIISVFGLIGECVSRATFRSLASSMPDTPAPAVTPVPVAGVVAVAAKPSVAEIRARVAAARPVLDARGLAMQDRAADIKPLANFIYRAMQVGVLLVAAGTFLGGWWADKSWGRFWGWDPKETWALITLLIYVVPLHGRFAGWVNTFGLVLSSVACFLSVLMAWYGVNFVLGVGLHTYGFTEGGGQGIVLAVTAAVLAFAGSAWWRRFLAYQVPAAATAPTSTVAVA